MRKETYGRNWNAYKTTVYNFYANNFKIKLALSNKYITWATNMSHVILNFLMATFLKSEISFEYNLFNPMYLEYFNL